MPRKLHPQEAARKIEKAWRKAKAKLQGRPIGHGIQIYAERRPFSFSDYDPRDKTDRWIAESYRVNRNWNSHKVPHSLRMSGKRKGYYYWAYNKKTKKWT